MSARAIFVLAALMLLPASAAHAYFPAGHAAFSAPRSEPYADVMPLTPEPSDGYSRHRAEREAAVVGDTNGDGIDDVAAVRTGAVVEVFHGRPRGASGGPRDGMRVDVQAPVLDLESLGDVNGDGRADLAIRTPSEVLVVHGQATGLAVPATVTDVGDVADPDPLPTLVRLGDVDGDGLPELAVGEHGAIRILTGTRTLTTLEAPTPGVVVPRPAGSDLLATWRDVGWDAPLDAALVPRPALLSAPSIALDSAADLGGWNLRGEGRPETLGTVPDQNRDGRRDLATWDRIVFAPPPGTRARLDGLPGFTAMMWWDTTDLGDRDGDGRPEIGVGNTVQYLDPHAAGRDWYHSLAADNIGGGHIIGTTTDVDGDGLREIAVVEKGLGWVPERVAVWRSTALPKGPDRYDNHVWAGPPPPPPPQYDITPWQPPIERDMQRLAATPVYERGGVTLLLRAPRQAQVRGMVHGRGWREARDEPIRAFTAQTGSRPYARVRVPLDADQRAQLAADGRFRLYVETSTEVHSGRLQDWAENGVRLISAIVVAPRASASRPLPTRRVLGSFGAQRLVGTSVDDLLDGRSADDRLIGRLGADVLRGGTGDDRLDGGPGDDRLNGDDGDDVLNGGPGDDELVETRFGEDTLRGGPGEDWLEGGRATDVLQGGTGDDVIMGGSGPDRIDCGPGVDVVFKNFSAERRAIRNCEHVYDEPGVIHAPCSVGGTDGPETLLGSARGDVCEARGGDDDVEGGGGHDRIFGGAGDDRLFGRFGADVIDGGEGDDELEGGRGRDTLDGGAGKDRLNGGYDPDVVRGGAGDDRITALGGGADRIDCGPGADIAIVDSADTVRGCEKVRRSGTR